MVNVLNINKTKLGHQEAAMLNKDNHQEYQQALNDLAYSVSHRFRRPISTMLGLVELMRLGLLKEEEHELTINSFKTCLDELDKFSRELNLLIYRERERTSS
ncbi:MAG: hypothetical protein DI539_24940 [Flavobacterium psychrophilum]|nr:MAG: hypothetical protein DI539_24940 [Flavobacterium psychrophilum]